MPSPKPKKMHRSFYTRPTLEVAEDIIGMSLVYKSPQGKLSARIVEVEAYIGENDPACHAARGKTKRNEVMFHKGGYAYIYFIYGMYYCLNVVTEKADFPAALLIRGAETQEGIEIMQKRIPAKQPQSRWLAGPGKLCRAFNLKREQNGLDLTNTELYLENRNEPPEKITVTTRIGISKGRSLLYRFYDTHSPAVSRK